MIKSKFKRVTSLFLATLMCVTTFAGIGSTTAYAASGEKADVYMVDFPRDGDANYDGVWGHSNLTLKNGWHTGRSNFTNLKAIGSYSGNVAYCIEPGISLKVGQTMNKYDENYFNNLAANGVISGDEIRLFVGRILQYGYDDIINLPNPTSKNHPRMSLHDRAAQFAPFAALTGHDAAIKETARLTDERLELSDEVIMKLNDQLNMIRDNIGTEQEISITYFVPDDKKSGGAYLTHSGIVKKIDEFERKLIMQDETVIPTEQISVIQGEMFKGLYE